MTTRPAKAEHPQPPKLVDLARWLWIGSAVLGSVAFLLELTSSDLLLDELRKAQPDLGQSELDGAMSAAVMFSLLACGVLVLIHATIANRMARGRNWARILITVFGAGGIIIGLMRLLVVVSGLASAFEQTVSPVNLAFSLVTMAMDAAVLVLVFQPSVAGHFRSAPVGQQTTTPSS
ncbi:hypothetical protein [Umezawaea sp.]|uniref:hypothetical protein n=1 Tax=Umezawaea sp. TaxID=1955258 RepID=UPI002ED43D25